MSAPEMTGTIADVRAAEGERSWSLWTVLLIAGWTVERLLFVGGTDITNGEAYYYVWSRFPSLSYYDHPPLVAWMTWLTTRASHGTFAVRAGPLLCSTVFAALVYLLARRLFSPRAGFFAVAIITAIPLFSASAYVLNPEAPLAPLWVLGLLMLERMRDHDEPWRPLLAGLVAGLAFLAKYSGVLLLGVGLLYVLTSSRGHRWLRRPSLYLGALVALAVASPVLVWNVQRGWPSLVLHFVERQAAPDLGTFALNAWHVLLSQIPPFHPLIFPGLLGALVVCIRRSRRDDRFRFLALASWPVLLFFLGVMARVRDAESHWTMVGYIPLAIAGGGLLDLWGDRLSRPFRWYLGACVAVTLGFVLCTHAYSQDPALRRFMPPGTYDKDKDFFNEMFGWAGVKAEMVRAAQALGPDTVVASCQYALCAHVLTALDDRPPVYCPGPRRTEFDFLGRSVPPANSPVLYVQDEHYHEDPRLLLPQHTCQPLESLPVMRGGIRIQTYSLWACRPRAEAAR